MTNTYTVWVTRIWGRGTWDEECDETQVIVEGATEKEVEEIAICIVEEEKGYAPVIEATAIKIDCGEGEGI